MLERHQILDLMGELKLAGMRHAYDEVIADGIKRQHPHQHVVGELLTAEVADKHARSIKYQMTASKLPLAKEIAGFEFAGLPDAYLDAGALPTLHDRYGISRDALAARIRGWLA